MNDKAKGVAHDAGIQSIGKLKNISNTFSTAVSAFANYGIGDSKIGIDDNGQAIGIVNLELLLHN